MQVNTTRSRKPNLVLPPSPRGSLSGHVDHLGTLVNSNDLSRPIKYKRTFVDVILKKKPS